MPSGRSHSAALPLQRSGRLRGARGCARRARPPRRPRRRARDRRIARRGLPGSPTTTSCCCARATLRFEETADGRFVGGATRCRSRAAQDRPEIFARRLERTRSRTRSARGARRPSASRGLPDLVPIRHARMAESPFAFFRGGAAIMAHGPRRRPPTTGLTVQACGDAHVEQLREVRHARAQPRVRHQRLRRDAAGSVGVGRQAPVRQPADRRRPAWLLAARRADEW